MRGKGGDSARGLSKLNSMLAAPRLEAVSDQVQIRSTFRERRPAFHRCRTLGAPGDRRQFLRLPRKEVIQPHLPVRLPCYDFTPITGPTFDGSFPCGLGHRLRVLPTFVV
jgi:hypothetical protein